MRKIYSNRGFTLIEVIVAIAIVAILAGIITPYILKNIDNAKITKAQNDCPVIASAVASFYKDTGVWPLTTGGTTASPTRTMELLVGQGTIPTSLDAGTAPWINATTVANVDDLANHLIANNPEAGVTTDAYPLTGNLSWRGSYIAEIPSDPWGNRYAINIANITNPPVNETVSVNVPMGRVVWVLSAGPNGQIETAFDQNMQTDGTAVNGLGGDDIGYRLR